MTECNQTTFHFSSVQRRKIQVSFGNAAVSSDGGLVLIREVESKLGISKKLSDILPDYRNPDKVIHQQEHLIRQRLLALCAGYEDLNDHFSLRDDILFQSCVGSVDRLVSTSTLCRMENRGDRHSMLQMQKLLVEFFIAKHTRAPKQLILDFDATDDPTHGNQVGRFYHGYYRSHCFLPLYVFCGNDPLCALLRPANTDGARGAWAVLKYLVKRLRSEWGEELKIILRGDSGFMRPRMLSWCENNKVDYIVGYPKNARLLKQSAELIKRSAQLFEKTGEKQRLFEEYQYQAKSWEHPRKIVMKAEHTSRGENNRYIVTTLEGDPQQLYDEGYCGRGDMENRIKEQQLCMFADRTSCHEWWPNQLRLLLSTFAYLVIERLRAMAFKKTKWSGLQCSTIRTKLIKIGAVVSRNTRRIVIRLNSSYPYKADFEQAYQRVMSG